MSVKHLFLDIIGRFLRANPRIIFVFLDNPTGRKYFLNKYLKNRPEHFFSYYSWKPARRHSNNILILKTDAIGDYLLFRNFIREISINFKPKGYKIYLGGNLLWKELALELDGQWLDGSFWLNRKGLNSKPPEESQMDFLQKINALSFEKILYPNISREWEAGDWLCAHIAATEKWAFQGNTVNETEEQRKTGNAYYSDLIEPSNGVIFEFYRNKEIVSQFIGKESSTNVPFISNVVAQKPGEYPYVVLFPGASNESKQWPAKNFCEIAVWLNENSNLHIITAGSEGEKAICEEIINCTTKPSTSLAGKTSISGLLKLIAGCEILISNDTAALHMGILTGKKCIALWKGNHYGRFLPYPKQHFPNLSICTPPEFLDLTESQLKSKFSDNYGADIDSITLNSVKEALTAYL